MSVLLPINFAASSSSRTHYWRPYRDDVNVLRIAVIRDAAALKEADAIADGNQPTKKQKSGSSSSATSAAAATPDVVDTETFLLLQKVPGNAITNVHVLIGGKKYSGTFLSEVVNKKGSVASQLHPVVTLPQQVSYETVLPIVKQLSKQNTADTLDLSHDSLFLVHPMQKKNIAKPGSATDHFFNVCTPLSNTFTAPTDTVMKDLYIAIIPNNLVDCNENIKVGSSTIPGAIFAGVESTYVDAVDKYMRNFVAAGMGPSTPRTHRRASQSQPVAQQCCRESACFASALFIYRVNLRCETRECAGTVEFCEAAFTDGEFYKCESFITSR